jgi:hypothetical protein
VTDDPSAPGQTDKLLSLVRSLGPIRTGGGLVLDDPRLIDDPRQARGHDRKQPSDPAEEKDWRNRKLDGVGDRAYTCFVKQERALGLRAPWMTGPGPAVERPTLPPQIRQV